MASETYSTHWIMIAALITLALMVGGGILGGGMWAGSITTTLHEHGDAIQGIQRDVKDGYEENAEQHRQINQKIDTMGGKLDRIISSQWQTNHSEAEALPSVTEALPSATEALPSAQSSATPPDAEGFGSAHGAQPQ